MAHTPAPWHAEPVPGKMHNQWTVSSEFRVIAVVGDVDGIYTNNPTEDAHLIAAAPTMRAVIEAAEKHLAASGDPWGKDKLVYDALVAVMHLTGRHGTKCEEGHPADIEAAIAKVRPAPRKAGVP